VQPLAFWCADAPMSADDRCNIPTVDTTLVPALGKVVVREARSGERFSFAT